MKGLRFILIVTAAFTWQSLAHGQDIAEMQAKFDTQLAEIASLKTALDEREQAATRLDTDLARLRAATAELEQRKTQALEVMNAQFQRIVADPTLDLSSAQLGYRDALEALQSHQSAIKAKEHEIAATRQQIERIEADAKTAERRLTEIRVGFDVVRAERLYRELNVEGSVQLNNSVRCKPDETIAACKQRGSDTALQEAKRRFKERIYASVTEADLVSQQRGNATSAPTVIDSKITKSGFSGQGDYFVELEAWMRSELSQGEACALLGLTPAQCGGTASTTESGASPVAKNKTPTAPAMADSDAEPASDADFGEESAAVAYGNHMLTARSDVYYDEVFIDGISYGSTRLDVVLPAGEYDVEVRKPGHNSFKQRIRLDRDRTITASLPEQNG
jgi:hypothetical protein